MQASELRLNVADLSTIETLVQELAHPDPKRVVYAIDVLESLDKRNLVTPLLLYHESPDVRRRALCGARRRAQRHRRSSGCRTSAACSATPTAGVRAAAIGALSSISQEDAASLARPLLTDRRSANPRHGGGRAGRQLAASRTSTAPKRRCSSWPAAPTTRTRRAARRRRRASGRSRIRGSAGCWCRSSTIRRRKSPTRPWRACAGRRAKTTSSSCRRSSSLLRNRRLKGRARAALVVVRRAGRRFAGVLPPRSRRGHLGAPPHSRAPWRRFRRRRRSTSSSRRSRSATASSATRSCRRSSGCAASTPSSR